MPLDNNEGDSASGVALAQDPHDPDESLIDAGRAPGSRAANIGLDRLALLSDWSADFLENVHKARFTLQRIEFRMQVQEQQISVALL